MGRGRSKVGGGGGGGGGQQIQDFPEAFAPGKDFQAVNGVNHATRTVSRMTQAEWDQFAMQMNNGVTSTDEDAMMRQWSSTPNSQGAFVTGYVRTQNAFAINEALYDPANAGKTDAQIFKRRADRETVKALDKSINNNATPHDGSYTRFSGENAIRSTLGLSSAQMALLKQAPNMNASQLSQLNAALKGSVSHSKAYTSTSANRSLNAFSGRYVFERRINIPKGTKAYAPRRNAQESEVIFGRGMRTVLNGVSVSADGHIVLHESFAGYN